MGPGAPRPGAGAPVAARRGDPFGLGGAAPGAVRGPQGAPAARGLPAAPPMSEQDLLRQALTGASRELIERIAWEVVPQLAETIIREELERLIKAREGKG